MKNRDCKKYNEDAQTEGIVKHSIWISFFVCVGKVLGFVKQAVIAWAFGAGGVTDTYYAADGYTSMIGQIMSQSVGPTVLTQYIAVSKEEGEEKSRELLYRCFCFFSVLGLFLALISIGASGLIAKLVGISYTAEQRVELQKIIIALCPVMFITPISGVCSAYLDSNKRFIPSKLCSVFFSVSITITLLLFRDKLGIWALTIGFIAGYLLHMFYMLAAVRRSIKIRLKNPFGDKYFKVLLNKFGPMVVGNSVVDLGHLIDRVVASALAIGSVSILFYGQVVSGDLVNAVVITTVGTVLLTSFSSKVANKVDLQQLRTDLQGILCTMACITCFITALYFIEGKELIRIFFERGSFDSDSTDKVFQVACAYSVGFMFMAFREVLIKAHFAFLDTFSPMINSIIGVTVNILGSIILSRFLGVWGIALATSLSMFIVAGLSAVTLKKHIGKFIIDISFVVELLKYIVSALITVLIGSKVICCVSELAIVLRMGIVTLVMLLLYFLICLLFKCQVVKMIFSKGLKKFRH